MSTKRFAAQITIGGAITGALKSALGTTKDKLTEIGGAVRKLEREQKMLGNSIGTFSKMGANVDGLRARYAAVTAEIEKTRKAQERLKAAGELRDASTGMMAKGGLMIGGAVAAAMTMGKPVRESAELEHNLQMIGNTANMGKAEIGALKNEIFAVSKASNKSIGEVTAGIGFLIAAGMEAKTATATIGTVAKAATATGASIEDLARAAFTLNDSLNINPEQTKQALNILAQAGKEGNVELRDMAKQLPVLGSGFRALKMDGTEAAATIGAALQIARKGAADADEAANNMKNFIAKVMAPDTLKKAKKEFGIDLYAIIQNAQKTGGNPFEAAMKAIIKATAGDQKKIGELFGDMQVQNFLRPMIEKWDEYERIKRKALNSGEVVDEDFAKMMETMKEQTQGLGNAWTRLMTTLGDGMAPAIGSVAKSLTGLVESAETFTKENPQLVTTVLTGTGAVIGLTAALGAGKMAVGAIGYALSAVPWSAMGTACTWLATTALPAVVTGIRAVTLAMVSNPIGLVAAGLATAAFLVWKNWEPIKGFFVGIFESVKASLGAAVDWIIGKIQTVGEYWGRAKAFFGIGGDTTMKLGATATPGAGAAALPGASAALPAVPAMRTNSPSGQTITNNVQAPITINQQPGQNSKELADEVARRLKEREGVQRRGMMYDHAMGY